MVIIQNTSSTQVQASGVKLTLLVILTFLLSFTISAERLKGTVTIDGSSTVYPISEAVAEEFLSVQPRIRVMVGISGTGGGFKKFLAKETDFNNASRPIKAKEMQLALDQGNDFLELPIAYDGLSIVVNIKNTWVDYLTIDELNKIWKPGSLIVNWSDLRDTWPAKKIRLYGPGPDSGTFDYFTETINGKSGRTRSDYSASEDDNALVRGISGDMNAMGYFGYAYYVANKEILKIVPIDAGQGPVLPTFTTINNGSYQPLSRPLFIYVRTESLKRAEVREFVNYYIEHVAQLSAEVGYVPLPKIAYDHVLERIKLGVSGTAYVETEGAKVDNILSIVK